MIKVGRFNRLKIVRLQDKEAYLDGGNQGEIRLLDANVSKDSKVGDELNVFVYVHTKNTLQGTTKTPLAQTGDVAWLKVVSVDKAGAFLDWGLDKDLLLPFSEQTQKVFEERSYLVKIFLDESNRIVASMVLDDFIQDEAFYFKEGQKVDLIITDKTDLGVKAIINNEYWGVLYNNEIFQKLTKGQKTTGFIKKIRTDNRIDLVLQIAKYAEKVDSVTQKILDKLKSQGGVILVNDKSPAELIYNTFGVSKKVFKQSMGGLYKKRIISINKEGISLLDKD